MDVRLVKAARQVYDAHCYYRPDLAEFVPEGVVINRATLRGDVLYHSQPALLPEESFIALVDLDKVAIPELSMWP
ncbi:MAG: hypothetical protein AAFY15_16665 [Cyanobacteria bacterium J06648_11]